MDIWARADAALNGDGGDQIARGLTTDLTAHEVAQGVLFCEAFANLAAVETAAGVLLVDTGTVLTADAAVAAVRGWSAAPVRWIVLTHGHVDHVMGVAAFDAEAERRGEPRPEVIAHRAVPERFEIYRRTAGYNGWINHRQFGIPPYWPATYREPDRTYEDRLELELGGERFVLRHSRGETDDQTWLWAPERRLVCCGDLYIGVAPNAGNPQKRQRFALEWAEALDEIVALEPEILLPGHGLPLRGEAIPRVLGEMARWLRHLHDETVRLMNEGLPLDVIVSRVRPPEDLAGRPYLREVYDEAEFTVRNVWRRYGGWWDGNPARLHPPSDVSLAAEVATLAGGAGALAQRALRLLKEGEPRLAAQLAEWAMAADPDSDGVAEAYSAVYSALAGSARSLMSRGIYEWASARRDSRRSGTNQISATAAKSP